MTKLPVAREASAEHLSPPSSEGECSRNELLSQSGGGDGWRPIETAPKDVHILAYKESWGPVEAHWEWGDDEDYEGWIATHHDQDFEPTHWRPLPQPPEALPAAPTPQVKP
jgi:hypothetical protein